MRNLITEYAVAQLLVGAIFLVALLIWDHHTQQKKRGRGPWHKQ